MSEWREVGEPCPLPGNLPAGMDMCQPCPYFRGATNLRDWRICCNWPRNGSDTWAPRDTPLDDLPADDIRRIVTG